MRSTLFVAPLLLLAAIAPAIASACESTTTHPNFATPTCGVADDACFYVIVGCLEDGCIFSVWIYRESNGKPGLQRGDEVHDDTCGGQHESDTIVF